MAKRRKIKEMPPTRRAFAKRLESARVTAGFESQKDFAASIGIEAERYRTWERGDREPDLTYLGIIATRLDVSLDWLILGKRQVDGPKRAISA